VPMVQMQKKYAGEYQINMFVPDLHSFTTPSISIGTIRITEIYRGKVTKILIITPIKNDKYIAVQRAHSGNLRMPKWNDLLSI